MKSHHLPTILAASQAVGMKTLPAVTVAATRQAVNLKKVMLTKNVKTKVTNHNI